jgi:C-terminal processing protease CtpA/Prc
VGEYLLAVDESPVDSQANLDQLLDRKIGRRVVLRVSTDAKQQNQRDVAIRPTDLFTERTLVYRDWVQKNRQLVAKLSKGRLGYVHIPDMGGTAVARLTQDIDAEAATREGVIVDVRANTGGFASPYVLDVLSRKGYLTIGRRGAVDAPGRSYVGQRALDLPTILVTNGQSVSDAENFTEGYRALKLGKVVGESTAGGVIFTSDVQLLDGTSFRIPFSKVTNRAGQSLEGDGRPVDVKVRRPLGESPAGKDTQLEAAVREMLKQVDKSKPKEAAAPGDGKVPALPNARGTR